MKYYNNETMNRGQTLIETMVAVFMLVMGVAAAVGLAIFALNSSSNITKQIIATGLAREGLEAVRAMRGTNWLKDTLSTNCYNYQDTTPPNSQDAKCYKDWLGKNGSNNFYCLNPSTGNGNNCNGNSNNIAFYLGFDSSSSKFWIFDKANANYGINFNSSNSGTSGFYSEDGNTNCLNATSDYCRSVVISLITTPPYGQDVGPLVLVKSQVWWVDKKCPRVSVWPGAGKCSVELVTELTNWKNY